MIAFSLKMDVIILYKSLPSFIHSLISATDSVYEAHSNTVFINMSISAYLYQSKAIFPKPFAKYKFIFIFIISNVHIYKNIKVYFIDLICKSTSAIHKCMYVMRLNKHFNYSSIDFALFFEN